MSTQFDRVLYGFRFVDTLFGDSLQTIAARELGDAARWTDLIAYNKLVPPFITDDPAEAGPGIVLTGRQILVPAPEPVVSSTTDPDAVFGKDIRLGASGALMTKDGDFDVVSGSDNLVQALSNRIETDFGDLIYHKDYGCGVRRVVGIANGPTATLLAARYAKEACQADPRVSSVKSSTAVAAGAGVSVSVDAEAVSGRVVSVTATP